MNKLFMMFLISLFTFASASAFNINDIHITDHLNSDLSMTENILLNIENNTENAFTMNIPAGAFDVLVNGNYSEKNITSAFACEKCIVSVNYSFPGIVRNDSGLFTFFRKIDLPLNISTLTYKIELPYNYTLFNSSNLSVSIIPSGVNILDNRSFEWTINKPRFPIEFGVRYVEEFTPDNKNLSYGYAIIIMVILLLLCIALLARRIINRRKNKIVR